MAQQREARLVNEYLFENYRNYPQWKRVRLGPAVDKPMARMFKVTMRWADAIVHKDNEIIIIEAKMFPEFGGLGQLEAYAELLSRTPEFSKFKGMPLKLIYLTTRADEDVQAAAKSKEIEYVIFRPSWVEQYERERFKLPPLK